MHHLLALTIGGQQIQAPATIPTGGLEPGGAGETLIQGVISWMLLIGIILSLIFVIWSGIKWITSAGDKAKIESARKTLIFAIVGLIVVMSAFIIIKIIGTTLFGVNPLNLNPTQPRCIGKMCQQED